MRAVLGFLAVLTVLAGRATLACRVLVRIPPTPPDKRLIPPGLVVRRVLVVPIVLPRGIPVDPRRPRILSRRLGLLFEVLNII